MYASGWQNVMGNSKQICSNCKRMISEHNEKEFFYCTEKIMSDLILADENHRRMINKQKNS